MTLDEGGPRLAGLESCIDVDDEVRIPGGYLGQYIVHRHWKLLLYESSLVSCARSQR